MGLLLQDRGELREVVVVDSWEKMMDSMVVETCIE